MGIALELLMTTDDDVTALLRAPRTIGAFLKENWSGNESEKDLEARRSMSICRVFLEIDGVLLAGRPAGQFPLGFLQGAGHVLGQVKRTRQKDDVAWRECEDENSFPYGPPDAFLAKQVAEIHDALASVNDEWVRNAYDPEALLATQAAHGR
jgi:hypothetical protein